MLAALGSAVAKADDGDVLAVWRTGVKIHPVCPDAEVHTIHTYFNTSPESPDGRYVLYFRSMAADAGVGQICIIERATGKQTVLASNVFVTDAHSVAGQQWVNGGRTVVFKDKRDDHWLVVAVDIDTGRERILARERLIGFGQPNANIVPLFGPYWQLNEHRDLELLDVTTGQIQTGVTNDAVRAAFPDWIKENYGDHPTSIFFGILSPNLKRVIFKLSTPSSGNMQSADSSTRGGLICYDLEQKKFLPIQKEWGHPAWYKDSKTIVQMHDFLINSDTGEVSKIPGLPFYYSSHPSSSPDGTIMLKDMAVPQPGIAEKDWKIRGIDLCDIRGNHELIIDQFDGSHGATSWRVSHPHPVFSADGRRIYYNVSSTQWTRLFVAEMPDASK